MIPQVKLLETLVRRGDLALRFTDDVLRQPVSDGLVVAAWVKGTIAPQFPATLSPSSGVYSFRALPGLRGYEMGGRPITDFCQGDELTDFVVAVEDRLGRYLPQLLTFCLPKDRVIDLPLFSSPARPTPSRFGAIRGELWDRDAAAPAAWARVTAAIGSTLNPADTFVAETMADRRGMFALFLPYAASLPELTGSPPVSTATPGQLQWQVTLTPFYKPSTLRSVAGSDVPELGAILNQPQGTLYAEFDEDNEVSASTLATTLRFGVELVVKTEIVQTSAEEAQDKFAQFRGRLLVRAAP